MKPIRLIREVLSPGTSGPTNGQYALQSLLRQRIAADPSLASWLHIGGVLRDGEIPWYWSWEDFPGLLSCCVAGWPFIAGPNVLFRSSSRPGKYPGERQILDSPHCRMLYTESKWYGDLIDRHRGRQSVAPLVLWPYPIYPLPSSNPIEPPEFDLLIYCKSGYHTRTIHALTRRWPRSMVLTYGGFTRGALAHYAERSCCCAYLSNDDRGPLALAEVLLCGCSAVGVKNGAPWIEEGGGDGGQSNQGNGKYVSRLLESDLIPAIEWVLDTITDRRAVQESARDRFDGRLAVETVIASLESVASD